jgi:hypothetical protein
VFFGRTPRIEYVDQRRVHVFECAASHCKGKHGRDVRRFLDTGDARSTSGLRRHAKMCWGDEAVSAADNTRDLDGARAVLAKSGLKRNGSITQAFERIGKEKVSYSHRQHTYTETRYVYLHSLGSVNPTLMAPRIEIVRWVAENKRPFAIVKDRGFKDLMKTGRPEYRLPSPATVARDVKHVFVNIRYILAAKLRVNLLTIRDLNPILNRGVQARDGYLNFATDAWTSPNGRAYVAVTVHFEIDGFPESLLLDIVECARSHTGVNLASTFAKVLKDFGISDKVRSNK